MANKEALKAATKWIRKELTKRTDGGHPSHLVAKVLAEADEQFALGSYGVEGWVNKESSSNGYQYLNFGDPYESTIVVRTNATSAWVFLAMGGWAVYA